MSLSYSDQTVMIQQTFKYKCNMKRMKRCVEGLKLHYQLYKWR